MPSIELTEQELQIITAMLGQASATGIEAMNMVIVLHSKLKEAQDAAQERGQETVSE